MQALTMAEFEAECEQIVSSQDNNKSAALHRLVLKLKGLQRKIARDPENVTFIPMKDFLESFIATKVAEWGPAFASLYAALTSGTAAVRRAFPT